MKCQEPENEKDQHHTEQRKQEAVEGFGRTHEKILITIVIPAADPESDVPEQKVDQKHKRAAEQEKTDQDEKE
jgi:hypothetical protein